MANITDYVLRARSMREAPFCEVDNLVLAQLGFLPWDGIVPGPGSAKALRLSTALLRLMGSGAFRRMTKDNRAFASAAARSRRLSRMRLTWYVNDVSAQENKQFSAVTFLLEDGSAYVAFRGTDEHFVGWTEDIALTYLHTTPSQKAGLAYLERAAALTPRPLYVGGHSKGGNVALYAAMHCSAAARSRIRRVFNNDGPGLLDFDPQNPGFLDVQARLCTFMPQASTVGMLLANHVHVQVVHSSALGGVNQHDPFSWQVEGNAFLREEKGFTPGARYVARTLNDWIFSLQPVQRETFGRAFAIILRAAGVEQVQDLTPRRMLSMVAAVPRMDRETRAGALRVVARLLSSGARNLLRAASMARPARVHV